MEVDLESASVLSSVLLLKKKSMKLGGAVVECL